MTVNTNGWHSQIATNCNSHWITAKTKMAACGGKVDPDDFTIASYHESRCVFCEQVICKRKNGENN